MPFETPLALDVRSLTKLARACDPQVSSLNVFADSAGDVFVWGLVDQEPRHGDQIALNAGSDAQRPGLFQATISGPGTISVFRHGVLWGSLCRDVLIETQYDVLWNGPVHLLLVEHLRSYVATHYPSLAADCGSPPPADLERELLVRWLNSLSRILVNVQQYRHGGGLVIVPQVTTDDMGVKYRIHYRRLGEAVVGMVRAYFLRNRATTEVMEAAKGETPGVLRAPLSYLRDVHNELEQRRAEILGCIRFIAALTCADGMVLLDKHFAVHGFGVELRANHPLDAVFMAGDANADPARLRGVEIHHFGTRHRAMMRYCHQTAGSLGFVVSQDGGIQAMKRIDNQLVVWENIDVGLAFNPQNGAVGPTQVSPFLRWLSMRGRRSPGIVVWLARIGGLFRVPLLACPAVICNEMVVGHCWASLQCTADETPLGLAGQARSGTHQKNGAGPPGNLYPQTKKEGRNASAILPDFFAGTPPLRSHTKNMPQFAANATPNCVRKIPTPKWVYFIPIREGSWSDSLAS